LKCAKVSKATEKIKYKIGILQNATAGVSVLSHCASWCIKEEFEDTKAVIRIRISKKNKQHKGQKKKYKRTSSDLQKIQA
jgi:hypothetical protein